jgi:hypothetical protein
VEPGRSAPFHAEGDRVGLRDQLRSPLPATLTGPLASLAQTDTIDFLIAVVIAAGLAMLIFRHADRHGSRHATAWGLFTFLAAIVAIPLYFASYWLGKSGRRD